MRRANELRLGLVLLPLLVAAPGCVRQWTRIEQNVDAVRASQVQQQQQIDTELAAIRGELQRRSEIDRETAAELNARLEAMERLVTQLSAQWEEQQKLLRDLRAALELVQRRGGGGAAPSETVPAPQTSEASSGEDDASNGTEVYDAAWADFTRGNYTLARQGFTELVDRFPDSSYAVEARYWIAETYYNQSSYQEALNRFQALSDSNPGDSTKAKCLLKVGYCHLALDDRARAIEALQQLVQDFPDSDEALIAENRLSTLNR